MKTIHLYQLSSTGRIKHLIITADGNQLITEWYTSKDGVDGKKQNTIDIISGVNTGKANGTTDEQQCILEWERKVAKKQEEGYSINLQQIAVDVLDITKPLPSEFCASKPITDPPEDMHKNPYVYERKLNGECLLLHKTSNSSYIYSRRIHDLTNNLIDIPCIQNKLAKMPNNSLVIGEFSITDENNEEHPELMAGLTTYTSTKEKVNTRLKEFTDAKLKIHFYVFDILFWDKKDITNEPFKNRLSVSESAFGPRVIAPLTMAAIKKARAAGWEGLIIRDMSSTITYTMNGKPKRLGSHKYVFNWTEDVFVTGAELGSGKFKDKYSTFFIKQYDRNGNLVDCGRTGYGRLSHEQVEELTESFKSKGYPNEEIIELKPEDYFCVELVYLSRHKQNKEGQFCFQLGIVHRLRPEKKITECIFGEVRIPTEQIV